MNDLGYAINELRKLALKSLDVTLRNGIAHGNYLIAAGRPPARVEYANIRIDRATGKKSRGGERPPLINS